MSQIGSPITSRHMEALWGRFEAIYGKKFSEEFGNAIEIWFRTFQERNLKPEDIKSGIDACLDSGDQFPPSLPKFLRMCRPLRAAAHVPFEPAPRLSLENRKQNQQKLSQLVGELKRTLGEAGKDPAAAKAIEAGKVEEAEKRMA
jgi:hypothetical protein